jgi:glycosyltransferase involved in cell wall biosynthesis
MAALLAEIGPPLQALLAQGHAGDLAAVLRVLRAHPPAISGAALLNAEPAFELLRHMYERSVPHGSFLQYFWSWRALVGGLLAVLRAPLPAARCYHAVSTGYAGLMLARAVHETGRSGLLTEHGIYTNERRIEIAMAPWLADLRPPSLAVEKPHRDLRDVWLDAFIGYSHCCYEHSAEIITLHQGNQPLQLRDGAAPERLRLIPNGVDLSAFAGLSRQLSPHRPTVALIGRVVPIKDVKTFLRAVHLLGPLLADRLPGLQALVLGPTDEDPAYHAECLDLVEHLGLQAVVRFGGQVRLADHLGDIDVVVLTSLSEAQPLVLLEAGAAGLPCVATDVGACREILEGRPDEQPPLGLGGIVTPLADPRATAAALASLLLDPDRAARCGAALRERAARDYSLEGVQAAYRTLYRRHIDAPVGMPAGDVARPIDTPRAQPWPA